MAEYDGDFINIEQPDTNEQSRSTPALTIIPKPESEGQIEPVLLVALSPSDELFERIAEYRNPHYMVTVAAVRREQLYNTDEWGTRYLEGKSYIWPVTKRPTQYVEFNRPGHNRISACVIDIEDGYDAKYARAITTGKRNALGWQGNLHAPSRIDGVSHLDVDLDEQMFAKEPAGWHRTVVDHIFSGRAFDECKYRGRLLAALAAEVPVQLAGLILRPLFLLTLWLMLTYDIAYKELTSIRVRSVLEASGGSAWLVNREGVRREEQQGLRKVLPWIHPGMLLFYAAIIFGVPGAVFGFINISWEAGPGFLAYWGYWETFRITWKWVAIAAVVIAALAGLLYLAKLAFYALSEKGAALPPVESRLQELRQATVAVPIKGAVPESAMSGLWFRRLKKRVCRPYAVK